MPEIIITTLGVLKLLSEINPCKVTGPDNIPARVLKETVPVITPMLTHLFQQSLNTSEIPLEWKQAYVTPIFKNGNKSDLKNYRPVSLTSIISKTMEQILNNELP